MADVTRTKRVLLNLVTNAFKHLANKIDRSVLPLLGTYGASVNEFNYAQGQILIRARLVITKDDRSARDLADDVPKQWLRFEVHDNGDGVPTDLRSQLFVGAFVSTPWSGKCEAPPTHDPRSGDPEPVSKVKGEKEVTSGVSEIKQNLDGAHRIKSESPPDRRTLPDDDPDFSYDKHGTDQYLNDFAKHQGSGLGLFVANLCVEEMGGTIGFRCARDLRPKTSTSSGGAPAPMPLLGGSVFWFDIPYVPVSNKIYTRPPVQLRSLDSLRESLCDSIGQGSDSNSTRSWCKGFHSEDDLFGRCVPRESGIDHTKHHLSGLVNDSYCIGESLEIDRDSGSRSIKTTSDTENPSIVNVREVTQSLLERPCVLVVDDSIMVQKLLCRSLASLNFETDTACNGREGLIKMKGKRYRAVLVDFLMPVMDGIAATAEFRAWERDLSNDSATKSCGASNSTHEDSDRQLIIGISANISDFELETAWKAGINHFIRKPVKVSIGCLLLYSSVKCF